MTAGAVCLLLGLLLTADAVWLEAGGHRTAGVRIVGVLGLALIAVCRFLPAATAFLFGGPGTALGVLLAASAGCAVFLIAQMDLDPLLHRPTGAERFALVLGADVPGGRIGGQLRRRLRKAAEFGRAHPDCTLVLCGGRKDGEPDCESRLMAGFLAREGFPPDRLLTEERSRSTRQNFRFAAELLAERGFSPPPPCVLVTSRYHCRRARRCAQAAGFDAITELPARAGAAGWLSSSLRECLSVIREALMRKGLYRPAAEFKDDPEENR